MHGADRCSGMGNQNRVGNANPVKARARSALYKAEVEKPVKREYTNRAPHLKGNAGFEQTIGKCYLTEDYTDRPLVIWNSGLSKHIDGITATLKHFMRISSSRLLISSGNDHSGAIMGLEYYIIGDIEISQDIHVERTGT
ncbi:hypothetical protein Tco_1263079 [Tanacetum coccineum]